MKICLISSVVTLMLMAGPLSAQPRESEPVRALLITGGAWHDFEGQKAVLTEGISARAHIDWTVVHEDGEDPEASDHKISVLKEDDWAEGYDVVVYSHCSGWVTDDEFIESIARVHYKGVPAVVLHCAIHSYRRAETPAWRELTGIYSSHHGSHHPFEVENLAPEHPVMKDFPDTWTTPNGELYHVEEVKPDVRVLARVYDVEEETYQPTVWTNTYGKARVFGTTIGHHTETMRHEHYLDLVTRGLLWASSCGRQ